MRQLIFISFPQSSQRAAPPAWGRVHITKSNEVLADICSKTGCPSRGTGSTNHTQKCWPISLSGATSRVLLLFITETKQPVRNRSPRNPPRKGSGPGNPHHSLLLSKELHKEFHFNSVKLGSWCGLTTEHCRCCHRLSCRVSVCPLTSHTSSALHRRQLHPQQLLTTLQHSLFQSTSVQSLVTKEQAGPSSARAFHEHYPCTAQRALPSHRTLPTAPGARSHHCTFRHSDKKVSGRESRVKTVSSEEINH